MENDHYYTFDIYLSATLLSLDFSLESLDRSKLQKVKFLFKKTEGLDKAIQSYWERNLRIEPQLLFTNLKFLKNRLYSEEL